MERTTPLYQEYKDLEGVRLIDFGGWLLPVNYKAGIIAEHLAVRSKVGMFDVSHMGECLVKGPGSLAFLERIATNTISSQEDGRCVYTFMCYENGTVVDDLLVYCLKKGSLYMVVMNASNVEKDLAWMASHAQEGVEIEDLSPQTVQIALQGPEAENVLSRLYGGAAGLETFGFDPGAMVGGERCLVSRTGYTGEDGFELYTGVEEGRRLWRRFLEMGVAPCGLGARDSLRMEAKLPLYGHEISDSITPLEANLKFFIDFQKDFIGRDALARQQEEGVPRSLRGFEMVDPGVARNGYEVFSNGERIGYVTTGAKSPSLDKFVGYALVSRGTGLKFGDTIEISIHGKLKKARLVRTPFCKPGRKGRG